VASVVGTVIITTVFPIFIDFPSAAVTIGGGLAQSRFIVNGIFVGTVAGVFIICR